MGNRMRKYILWSVSLIFLTQVQCFAAVELDSHEAYKEAIRKSQKLQESVALYEQWIEFEKLYPQRKDQGPRLLVDVVARSYSMEYDSLAADTNVWIAFLEKNNMSDAINSHYSRINSKMSETMSLKKFEGIAIVVGFLTSFVRQVELPSERMQMFIKNIHEHFKDLYRSTSNPIDAASIYTSWLSFQKEFPSTDIVYSPLFPAYVTKYEKAKEELSLDGTALTKRASEKACALADLLEEHRAPTTVSREIFLAMLRVKKEELEAAINCVLQSDVQTFDNAAKIYEFKIQVSE